MVIDWAQIGPAHDTSSMSDAAACDSITGDQMFRSFLREATASGEPLLVVVNDPMRATRSHLVLRAVERVMDAGATAPSGYVVLVATGTHRFNESQRRGFEHSLTRGLRVPPLRTVWHDARAPSLVRIGAADYSAELARHDRVLVIGSVEPHYFAGLTGPHKTLGIGCLSHSDIERNHAAAMHPAAAPLKLAGNPVYDDMTERLGELRAAGKRILAVGQVVRQGALVDVAVGDAIGVLSRLGECVSRVFVCRVASQVDVLHLRVAGPLGRTVYQADKAIKNCESVVRDGGAILVEAACDDGVGPDAFLRLLRDASGYDEAMANVKRDGYQLGDHKAIRLHALMDAAYRNVRIFWVARELPQGALAGTGIELKSDLDVAISRVCRTLAASRPTGLRVEDAGDVVAMTHADG